MDIPVMRAKLEELALGISRYLPAGWSLEVPKEDDMNNDRRFFRNGEMKFGISLDYGKPDRLNVSTWTWPGYTHMERGEIQTTTVWPHDLYDPKEDGIDITIGANRGADVIAKEIGRRFLPEYHRIWDRCWLKANQYQQHGDKSAAQWREVCRLLNKDPNHNNHYSALGPLSIRNNNGSLSVEGYLSLPQVKAIHTLLFAKEQPAEQADKPLCQALADMRAAFQTPDES